jgi:hypothetical protein
MLMVVLSGFMASSLPTILGLWVWDYKAVKNKSCLLGGFLLIELGREPSFEIKGIP